MISRLLIDEDYAHLLCDLKHKIKTAQLKAHRAVNTELILLYWSIGKELLQRQKVEAWGSKYLEQISKDLKAEFSNVSGFSERNLMRMRQFASLYHAEITPQAVAQLPWGHISVLIQKVKDKPARDWYAQQALQQGWSRNVLNMMLKQDLYARQIEAPKITNFRETLPTAQSDMAEQMFKDPYCFEFLTMDKSVHERTIENALINHIRDFLLELGQGFAFIANQYHLTVGGDDFYIDCLFYHLKLRCYVVIELKSGKFKPEYSGQLNFYLTAIDRELKGAGDQPAIGILLCGTKNEIVAQYAVDGMTKPMGISQYELGEALTARIKAL
jgi:predicted nuclease of restriction endonuclease-like (RecB) superfamily